MARIGTISKAAILILLFILIILFQYEYDASRPVLSVSLPESITPGMVKIFDMGFDSTVASALWAGTMPEILDFFHGNADYLSDFNFMAAIDPKLSYPYAFSVITIPATPYPDGLAAATAIGQEGLANADPDWRIAYYMAFNDYLWLKDTKDAITYFDIAARTPGIPGYAERFSLNFGVGTNERETVKQLWTTIRDSTNDEATKERAQAYIDRLDDLDYLEAAAKTYKQKFGSYPASVSNLATKGIIPAIPIDPFGFNFVINSDGTAGIDLINLPAYIKSAPQQ